MTAVVVGLVVSTILIIGWVAYRAGKDRTGNQVRKEQLDDIDEAARVRERYHSDAEYRKRMRDRFRR